MANKIKADDLIEKDVFKNTAQSAETLLVLIKEVKEELTGVLKVSQSMIKENPFKNSKDFQDYNKEYEKLKAVITELEKLTKEEIKLSAQVGLQKTEEAKRIALLKVQKQANNKQITEEAKLTSKATSEYQKQSIILSGLKKAYKELAIAGKENTAEAKKLLKEITELDTKLKKVDESVGEGHRSIGLYGDALAELFPLFGRAISGANAFGAALFKLAKNPFVLTLAAIVAGLSGLVALFKTTDKGATTFSGTMKGISNIMEVLRIRLIGVISGTLSLKEAFSGLGEEMDKAFQAGIEYEKELDRLDDAETAYVSQRAINANKIAKLDYVARDGNRLIGERIKALEELIKIELSQAEEEEKIAQQRYQSELRLFATTKNINKQTLDNYIQSAEDREELSGKYNFTDEEIKQLEESFAKTQEANTNFFEETKKANSRLQALRKENVDNIIKTYDTERQIELDALKSQIENGEINEDRIRKLREKTNQQILNSDAIFEFKKEELRRQVLEVEKKSIEEEYNLKKELLEKTAEDEEIKAINSIENEELKAAELLRIRKKLALDIAKLNNQTAVSEKDLAEKTAKEEKEILVKRVKQFEAFSDKVIAKINEAKEKEISAQEEKIEKAEKNIDRQEARAIAGLDNTLAYEKEAQAKAELEKRRLEEEQERRLKRQIYYKAIAASIEKNPDRPLKAIADALILTKTADIVAGAFKDGVEDFQGKGTETSDSNLVLMSKGESVVKAKAQKQVPGLVTALNEEGLAGAEKWFLENMRPMLVGEGISTGESEVVKELREIKGKLTQEGGTKINWNSHDERVESKIKNGMKQVVRHVSNKPRILS